MDLLDVVEFARQKHGNQSYGSQPYITHLLRVALQVDSDTMKTIALLHDVLEDTATTKHELLTLFGEGVADVVEILTRSEQMDYFDYINKVKQNPFATLVKIADLRDNIFHGENVYLNYRIRAQKVYRPALNILLGKGR